MNLRESVNIAFEIFKAHIKKGYHVPLSVYIFLTYRCSFKCLYCNVKNNAGNEIGLPQDKVLRLINEMAIAGTKRLHLTGGEPMTRDDIGEIINFAKRKGILVGLSSSGYLIPEKIDRLKDTDIVLLSFDGEEDIHDYARGEGSYGILMEAIAALRSAKIKFWTTTVLNKTNRNSIDFILKMAKEKEFIANFQILHSRNEDYKGCFLNAKDMRDFMMSPIEVRETISCLIEKKNEKERVGNSKAYLKLLLNWNDYPTMYKNDSKFKCWAGRLFCYMEPDGMLYPCGTLLSKVKGRDVIKLGFLEAFKQLPDAPCDMCLSGCQMEQNFILSLNWGSVINWYCLCQDE